MTTWILAEAEGEIESARQYFNKQSAGLGSRFLDDLAETLEAIEARPLWFPKLETWAENSPYRRGLLKVFRYAVIFELVDNNVIVVAVAHTSRAPNYWLTRRS